jgi:transposase-like protein
MAARKEHMFVIYWVRMMNTASTAPAFDFFQEIRRKNDWLEHHDPIGESYRFDGLPETAARFEERPLPCDGLDSEEECARLLYAARWPNGFRCPLCGGSRAYRIDGRRLPLFECADCRRQTSLTAGTIFEKSRTPLTKWFRALYLFATNGINATHLHHLIGTTYKTAWLMLSKFRYALLHQEMQTLLSGIVKIQISAYGTVKSCRRLGDPRSPVQSYPLLVGGSLLTDGMPTQVKIKLVPESELHAGNYRNAWEIGLYAQRCFAHRHISTDEAAIQYDRSYPLRSYVLDQLGRRTKMQINRLYGGIGSKHLQAYIEERCFRLNARLADIPAASRLLNICAASPPITYRQIVANNRPLPAAA